MSDRIREEVASQEEGRTKVWVSEAKSMTILELFKKLQDDERTDFHSKIMVYDPTKEDYVPATGYAVLKDGSVVLQTPS